MKNARPFRKRGLCRLMTGPGGKFLAGFFLLFFLAGCGKPPTLMHKYILEYPSPVAAGAPKVGEVLKVELFAVSQVYNSPAMIYQPHPYKSDSYNYNRWRVNPGYLVTDYLIRDLRDSRVFKAVLPYGSTGKSRLLLEGGVEEFLEIDAPGVWQAALAVNITLLDLNRQELPERVVFQKNYRVLEPMPEKTPKGLAQGMSRAMEKLSAQIIKDVSQAAAQRAKTPSK
ncbi:MAG: ABC-type transport auxiliary lipoprotein family protein [Thermodesulfobacteriota bacterium]